MSMYKKNEGGLSIRMQNEMLFQGKSCPALGVKPQFVSQDATHQRIKHFSTGCNVYLSEHYDYIMKIILLGDQGVGKSKFVKALKIHPDITKVRCRCKMPHLSDHLELEVFTSHGETVLVKLCDTGGQERYRSLTSSYYRGAHGVLLMYNVNFPRSLDNCETWLSDLDTFSSPSTCTRVLVGADCASPDRKVMSQQARQYAESRAMPYMEFDTTHYFNVVECIQLIVDRIAKEVTMSPQNSTIIKPNPHIDIKNPDFLSKKEFVCLC